MNTKLGLLIGGTAIGLSVTALSLLGVVHVKIRKIDRKLDDNRKDIFRAGEKLDKAVKDLADKTDVEVREDIVDKAIKQAVSRDVGWAVDNAVRQVRQDIKTEIEASVRSEIKSQKDKLISDVDRKLVEEVERISRDDIVNDVQRKITNMMIDRMDKDLNDIRDKYSLKLEKNLDDLKRRYQDKFDDLIRDMDWQRLGYKVYKI